MNAVQALFAADMGGVPPLPEKGADHAFTESLIRGVDTHRALIDVVLAKAAPDWPIDRIAPLDRNVLRLGLYELLYENRTDVPSRVAVDEAIELAKTFGGETSGSFVAGVLGTVYKEAHGSPDI